MSNEAILHHKKTTTLFKHFKLKHINLCFVYEHLTSKKNLKSIKYDLIGMPLRRILVAQGLYFVFDDFHKTSLFYLQL